MKSTAGAGSLYASGELYFSHLHHSGVRDLHFGTQGIVNVNF
ncbi:MAG TPA: hypothetical protein PLU53_07660 [Bacteroidia bacterium]|nr:hypothetical protein [Bacteroidia bacterium]